MQSQNHTERRGRQRGGASWNRGVRAEAAGTGHRVGRRETPEISERLRKVGWGRRGSAGTRQPEFLDAGLEGGGLEAQEGGGAGRPADAPAGLVQRGLDLGALDGLNSATFESWIGGSGSPSV